MGADEGRHLPSLLEVLEFILLGYVVGVEKRVVGVDLEFPCEFTDWEEDFLVAE